MAEHDVDLEEEGLFIISVAARLVGTHSQTLRNYERWGLLQPQRTERNIRLYSRQDVERARRIRTLTDDLGVNMAGVEVILNLLDRLETLQQETEQALSSQRKRMEQQFEDRLRRLLAEWSSTIFSRHRPAVPAGDPSPPEQP